MNRANRIYSRPGIFYIFLALVFTQLEPTQAQVYFKADAGKDFRFGNQYLERCFELKNDTWRTTWLVNKRTGHTWRVSSDEFRIRAVFERLGYWAGAENPLEISASSCVLHSYRIEPEKDGTRRLIATYHWEQGLSDGTGENTDSRSPGLDIEVFYTLARDEPYMRKTLRVSCPEPGLYFIEELAVENMTVAGAAALHQGFGQPVYTEEMFFGLEYPAGNNRVDEQKRLELFYYPGAEVGIRGVESYSAVWGAARWMRTRAAFLDYVKDIRIAPARPFLLYNTWYDMRTPERAQSDKGETRQGDNLDHTNCLERIQSLKKNLVDHGIELNSFVLDEGWDKYTPSWEIDRRNFPGGFSKLCKALEGIGSALGLWIGPIGGYGEGLRLRGEAGRKAGLEVSRKGYLDHAGPKYNRLLTRRLLEYIDKYDVNYYKFDGLLYGYAGGDHGYLPGIYSREKHTSALAALLDTLHCRKPGIFTNITTSNWLSPWWLMHADCVFMGGRDYGWLGQNPSISRRDQAVSYRDKVLYENFRRFEHQFPANSIMTVGVIKGEYEYLGDPDETLDKWADNLVMHFSRGLAMWELYISPHVLSDDEWRCLRSCVNWAGANSETLLANTTMVGGDPARGEPYGYFHSTAEKMILTVRNPGIQPATFGMKLDYEHGWLKPNGGVYLPLTVYPYRAVEHSRWLDYGKTIEVRLSGYETRVIEFVRREEISFPVVRQMRFDLSPDGDGFVLYPERSAKTFSIENTGPEALTVSGVPVAPGLTKEVPLEVASPDTGLEIEDRHGGLPGLAGELAFRLPTGTVSAELAFLLEMDGQAEQVKPVVTDNGQDLALRTVTGDLGNWHWFVAPLATGEPHRIAYDFPETIFQASGGKLSAWLILHCNCKSYPVDVPGLEQIFTGRTLPLPGTGIQRTVECLFDRPVRF